MPRKYKPKTDRKNSKHKAQTMESLKFQPGFIVTLDGRTAVAKALEHSYNAICADLGSEANLSYLHWSNVPCFSKVCCGTSNTNWQWLGRQAPVTKRRRRSQPT